MTTPKKKHTGAVRCIHKREKRRCRFGGPLSSCGKDLCKEHGKMLKGRFACKECRGVPRGRRQGKRGAWHMAEEDFDVAPWDIERWLEEEQETTKETDSFETVASPQLVEGESSALSGARARGGGLGGVFDANL